MPLDREGTACRAQGASLVQRTRTGRVGADGKHLRERKVLMKSSLRARLAAHMTATPEEEGWIARLETTETTLPARHRLVPMGAPQEHMHVLRYGWAVVRAEPAEGRAPIVRLYLPGEIIGLAEIGQSRACYEVAMQTDGAVNSFDRRQFAALMAGAPRLGCLLMALASREEMLLRERLRSFIQMDGQSRVIHFLLEIRDRLAAGGGARSARFDLPLRQSEIGEILGLSKVYVNRIFTRLRKENRIAVEGRSMRLLDADWLEGQVGYRDLLGDFDANWCAGAAASC